MALNIRNAETERLAAELALLTGQTKTAAVTAAIRHQVKNRVTAAAYAARVCGLRIWAVTNSTVRSAACGPARRMVAGRPSICHPPDRTSASGAAATGARAPGAGRPVCAPWPPVPARGPSPVRTVP